MMVETMLESSQDFGMSNGALPQWKRELLQRRAARSRPAPAPPPLPGPQPPDDDEELRYGPGIVKRLKSRYLSLALRDAPRRRPSVLRRAASLEHLLDERLDDRLDERPPPPAPRPRAPRPASLAAPPPKPRRDVVKRARSVDALSRLDSRDDPPAHSPPPPPPPPCPPCPPNRVSQTPPGRARPPRRPTPLLRETERPPPDVVRAALRKFESAPTRRPAPAARVSAVLRGLEGPTRTSTPEPTPRSPTPPLESTTPIACDTRDGAGASLSARPVSRAALEGIARAGSSMRFAFEAPRRGSHLPPLAAANPVLVGRARRVGVIRPMPAPALRSPEPSPPPPVARKPTSPPPSPAPPDSVPSAPMHSERKEPPPSALVEPIPRSPPADRRQPSPQPDAPQLDPEPTDPSPKVDKPLMNGHAEPRPIGASVVSRLGDAHIERAWNGTGERKPTPESKEKKTIAEVKEQKNSAPWAGGSPLRARRGRAPPPVTTSIVFNFSDRKEVPDYIENDGIVLRGSRRTRLKAGEPGVVALWEGAGGGDAVSSDEEGGAGPPSPCYFRFVNDNVLINGRSCMAARPNRDRLAKLKLQFDDSLTRTFEYPSETSLSEDAEEDNGPPSPHAHNAHLLANTHIASAALSRYTPSKTASSAFQLGVTRHAPSPTPAESETVEGGAEEAAGGDARPCGADARSWSATRTLATDLLFWYFFIYFLLSFPIRESKGYKAHTA